MLSKRLGVLILMIGFKVAAGLSSAAADPVFVIIPYRDHETWRFDDPDRAKESS
jgi:hypothetical protein